ncbi:hypothetical protein E3U55_15165 [Filobacillus milosensis]|uniref:Type 4 fimbrial biogenesis protein PilX N-terminal domain-containing protein n=1 Tax=Filobacillus milosensis TaxID=94137 RepID=A0A4Y8IFV9_9BACI|nr:hypothetical protein [Filobacillus milosensis]TFB13901.1 hypothetical protein E3U55_15165 [Filobacillus milosensis]
MFKNLKNEQGAALVVVLLTIALIMLFSTVMMNSILSNAKQNDITEQNYRSTHLAEMGATFIKDRVIEYMRNNEFEATDDYFSSMQSFVESEISGVTVDREFPERSFEITADFTFEENDRGALLNTEVTGHDENISNPIQVTLQLISGEESVDDWEDNSETFPDPPAEPDYVYEEDVTWKKNDCPDDEDGSYYVKGDATFNCEATVGDYYSEGNVKVSKSHNNLTVNGTAVFMGVEINNKTRVKIHENAFINKTLTSENNPNSEFLVCGNARFKEGINYRGQFGVRGYVISDGPVNFENNPAKIGNDTIFKDGLNIKNTSLDVGGNLTVYTNQTNISTFGGTINVAGDLTIYEKGQSEPIINPDWQSINYTDSGPDFPECEGIDYPSGSGGDPSVDLDNADY